MMVHGVPIGIYLQTARSRSETAFHLWDKKNLAAVDRRFLEFLQDNAVSADLTELIFLHKQILQKIHRPTLFGASRCVFYMAHFTTRFFNHSSPAPMASFRMARFSSSMGTRTSWRSSSVPIFLPYQAPSAGICRVLMVRSGRMGMMEAM